MVSKEEYKRGDERARHLSLLEALAGTLSLSNNTWDTQKLPLHGSNPGS
jgi:hypothetical protein